AAATKIPSSTDRSASRRNGWTSSASRSSACPAVTSPPMSSRKPWLNQSSSSSADLGCKRREPFCHRRDEGAATEAKERHPMTREAQRREPPAVRRLDDGEIDHVGGGNTKTKGETQHYTVKLTNANIASIDFR